MRQDDLIITEEGTFIRLNPENYKSPGTTVPPFLQKFFNTPMFITRKKIKLNSAGGYIDPEIKAYGMEIDPTAIIGMVDLSRTKDEDEKIIAKRPRGHFLIPRPVPLKDQSLVTKIGPGVILCDGVVLYGRHALLQGDLFIGQNSKLYNGVQCSSGVFIGENNALTLGREWAPHEKQIGRHCIIGDNNDFILGANIAPQVMLGSGNHVDTNVAIGFGSVVGDMCRFKEGAVVKPNSRIKSGSLVGIAANHSPTKNHCQDNKCHSRGINY